MNTRIAQAATAAALAVVATTVPTIGTAHAASNGGCPSGYTVMAVADLAPQGYQVPGAVDDPTSGVKSFGRAGNGDGRVCALALGNRTTPWGGQLYNFWDNTLAT
jgi:hypothetical protein